MRRTWFEPLYRDLEDGGTNEFLYFLQDLRLGDWHPRKIVKTAETAEQQRMSGDSISQWSQACIYADLIIGTQFPSHELEQTIPSEDLREAYAGYCRQHGAHPVSETAFGKACVEMFGHRKRLRQIGGAGHTMTVFGPSAEAGLVIEHRIEAAPAAVGGRQQEPARIAQKKRHPWGYDVPDGDKWQEKIDARLGIRGRSSLRPDLSVGLTMSRVPAAGGTAKAAFDWAYFPPVSPVSPIFKIIRETIDGIITVVRKAYCSRTLRMPSALT